MAAKTSEKGAGCVVLFGIVFALAWLFAAGMTLWQSTDPTVPVTVNDRPATPVEAQLFLCCFSMLSVVAATTGVVIATSGAGAKLAVQRLVAGCLVLLWYAVAVGVATRPLFAGGPPILGMTVLLTYGFLGLLPAAYAFGEPGEKLTPRPLLVTLTKLGAGTAVVTGALLTLLVYLGSHLGGRHPMFAETARLHRTANYALVVALEIVLAGWFLGYRWRGGRLERL